MTTPNLFEQIADLNAHAGDPATFSRLRREILAQYFASIPPESRAQLQVLQDEIETTAAINCNARNTVLTFLAEITDRCEAMRDLNQRCKSNW